MKMLSALLLSSILIPSFTFGAEEPTLSIIDFSKQPAGTEQHITKLCETTKDILKRHDKLNLGKETTNNLLFVIQSVKELKQKEQLPITERQLGLFAYHQKHMLMTTDALTTDCRIALFFERLRRFNLIMDKCSAATIPTVPEYMQHLENQKKEKQYAKALEATGPACGIYLPSAAIKSDQPPFKPLSQEIDGFALENLIAGIMGIAQQTTEAIQTLAELVYVHNQEELNS